MTASQKPINVLKFIAFHSKITFVCFGFHNQITQRSIPSIPAIPRGYLPDRTSVFISQIVNNNHQQQRNAMRGIYKIACGEISIFAKENRIRTRFLS